MTDDQRSGSGGAPDTTNQRMELTAVLEAIRSIDGPVEIHSDSTYVVNCFNDTWYEGWLARGWKNSQKKPVANRDLWEPLIDLYLERADEITFTWVKGHAGNEMNELADALAVEALQQFKEDAGSAPAGLSADTGSGPEGTGPDAPWPVECAIVITGLRELDSEQLEALEMTVEGLDQENDVVISGLRLGAELLGAELAQALGVPVGVVLPFPDPVQTWSARDRSRFDAVTAAARWTITLDGDPAKPGVAIKRRNQWMWESAVGAIVVGDEGSVEQAELAGLGVIPL